MSHKYLEEKKLYLDESEDTIEKFEIKRILHIKVEIKALGSPSLFPNANTAKLLQKPHM